MLVEASADDLLHLRGLRERVSAAADYYQDPIGWVDACVDVQLTGYQREILAALPVRSRVAVRGPHALGKTQIKALAVLWFALTRDQRGVDWKAVTTAGAWRQLEKFLWPEIHKWAARIRWDAVGRPPLRSQELLTLNLKLAHGAAFPVASDDPALIEGVHADSVLYVFDESKSIAAGVFDAAEGALSAATTPGTLPEAYALASSTPGEPSGRFYDIHARRPGLEDWWTRHVTLDEAVEAGRVSPSWAEQRAKQWGRDSALYANRVLGEFHSSDEDSIVPLSWVESAVERWRAWRDAGMVVPAEPRVVGVDVARSGEDRTAVAVRHGHVVAGVRTFALEDTMATTGRVAALLTHPSHLAVVDVIGIGAGVVDRLREQGFTVTAFNASERPSGRDRSGEVEFLNARAEAWWRLRDMLDPATEPTLCLPDDDELVGDLCAPRWKMTSAGKIQVEGKDEIRRRLGRSTDRGDAVVQCLLRSVRSEPAHAFYAGWEPERAPWWEP